MRERFEASGQIFKVDNSLGLVFGWAIVCKEDGEDYFDVQDDHIPEDAMLKAAAEFMADCRVAKEMHSGEQLGQFLFAWPLTSDIAKSMGVETKRTGLMVAGKFPPAILEKFQRGELTGFSIGGIRLQDEEIG